MRTNLATVLDPSRRSNDARDFETALRRKIVGQDQAIEKVAEIYQMFLAGLNAPGRPVGNLLLLCTGSNLGGQLRRAKFVKAYRTWALGVVGRWGKFPRSANNCS